MISEVIEILMYSFMFGDLNIHFSPVMTIGKLIFSKGRLHKLLASYCIIIE